MEWSRREVLGTVAGSLGAVAASTAIAEAMVAQPKARARPANEPFGYCLNTSTVRGNQLDIVQVVAAASKAGFHAIEPWITELDAYTKGGGSLKDLGKRIADAGLTVENAIAFNSFLTDDETQRATGMERMKVDMDKVAQIGGARIAAVPGNSRGPAVTLDNAAKYYREALEMGEKMGVAAAARAVGHASGARPAAERDLRGRRGRPARREHAARRVPSVQERHSRSPASSRSTAARCT